MVIYIVMYLYVTNLQIVSSLKVEVKLEQVPMLAIGLVVESFSIDAV